MSVFEGGLDENSADMDKAMGLLIAVAEAGFIAVDVMQHQGKASGTSETTLGYRGSSAIFAALAEMSTLAPLSAEEGAEFGLDAMASAWTIRLRGQRQRDGRIGGEWYFSRSILGLPAEDPRAPGVLASKDVAVLTPVTVARVSTGAGARLDGLRTLWGVQQSGGLVLRGQARGGQVVATWAHSILGRAHGWTQAQAEAALADWGARGRDRDDGKLSEREAQAANSGNHKNPSGGRGAVLGGSWFGSWFGSWWLVVPAPRPTTPKETRSWVMVWGCRRGRGSGVVEGDWLAGVLKFRFSVSEYKT